VIENAQPQFEREGIRLVFDHPETCLLVSLDPRRITQVLNNLLQNALRFTPKGGQVRITMACRDQGVTIQVQDSGEGIPPDALEQVFDRFYRTDQSRAREKGGSGLGLTIARGLVQAHGGTLTASNAPEGGAVFTIYFPI